MPAGGFIIRGKTKVRPFDGSHVELIRVTDKEGLILKETLWEKILN